MKRIILMLTVAAMFVVAMTATAVPAFAAPNPCPASNPNCVVTGPGNSENTPAANGHNPNIKHTFHPGTPGGH